MGYFNEGYYRARTIIIPSPDRRTNKGKEAAAYLSSQGYRWHNSSYHLNYWGKDYESPWEDREAKGEPLRLALEEAERMKALGIETYVDDDNMFWDAEVLRKLLRDGLPRAKRAPAARRKALKMKAVAHNDLC